MYVKKLICQETLKLYNKVLNKAISEGAPHSAKTIVDTLRAIVMNHVPRRVRLTKVLQRSEKRNQMGDMGQHVMTFTESLLFELHQSSWATMTQAEAGVCCDYKIHQQTINIRWTSLRRYMSFGMWLRPVGKSSPSRTV